MKVKFTSYYFNQIFFLIIFNFLSKSFQQNNNTNDYKCYEELRKEINNTDILLEHNKLYPWITDHMGKGLNDLGDELECLNSLINTTFLIVAFNSTDFFFEEDKKLLDFLEVEGFSVGICVTIACNQTFHIYFQKFIEMMKSMDDKSQYNQKNNSDNNSTANETKIYFNNIFTNDIKGEDGNNDNIIEYIEFFKFSNKYKYIIILCFLSYIFLKIVFGIIRLIIFPKGYDKYVAKSLQKDGKLENIDKEEQKAFLQRNADDDFLTDDLDYNPFFDLESYFPKKIKIFKFFDFFSDFSLLTTKRNRYYNDNGLETIIFMKAIVILFLIFYGTFYSLLSLPSKDIFNKSFFKSLFLLFYKMSINSLDCWILLEGAYSTYKLMFFIKTEMIEDAIRNNRMPKIEKKLFIIYGKFFLLFIPKISLFFIIYYFFYYKVEDFHSLLNAKRTYSYIISRIFKKNIKCGSNPFDIFNFNIFSREYKDYNECYEFTYVYFNLFICSFLFMVIIYISFSLRSKIFEIIIIFINIILYFISVIIIKDEKVDDNDKYLYYHLVGQKYSIKIFYSLLGLYNLGYIFGFMLFHYENNKYKFKNNINVKNEIRKTLINNINIKENKKLNEENNIEDLNNNKDNNNILEANDNRNSLGSIINNNLEKNKPTNLNYYPLSFLLFFLFFLNSLKSKIKKAIIFICLLLLILLSMAFQIYLNAKDTDFEINLTTFTKIYFLYEKHIFIIIFFIMNSILIVLPKKKGFKNIINSSFIIAIGRAGFTITCLYYFLCYFCFSSFFIKVKYHIPTFILVSIGNFLIIFFVCFICNIIFELPIRIVIKKLLRINQKKY